MNKIITPQIAIKTSEQLKRQGKSIVLVGGCFDILHIGHVKFLQKAKEAGGILFVILESDKTCRLKGKNRPINSQVDRAKVLSALEMVDYIIPIPKFENKDYDDLISRIKPDTIATTKGDPFRIHKEKQAKLVNAKVVDVIEQLSNKSTTRLVKLLSKDF